MWRQTGKQPQQLANVAALPAHAAHLWGWFISLNNERGNNEMGPSRITAQNVKDWMWFNGLNAIELWEKKALKEADNVWISLQKSA